MALRILFGPGATKAGATGRYHWPWGHPGCRAALGRVSDGHGIARVAAPAYAGHKGQPLDLTPQNRAAARDWLDPHYSFVADYMGRLPPSRATAERQTT